MPPSRLPPTPSMSSELVGKEKPSNEGVEFSFQLPPAAINTRTASNSQSHRSPSVCFPASPTSPDLVAAVSGGHRSAAGSKRSSLEDLDLPPPPTRTRRIIQMNPKTQDTTTRKAAATMTAGKASKAKDKDCYDSSSAKTGNNNSSNNNNNKSSSNGAPATNSKKKQGNSTNAAGKKVARKTAHSLIERRRRSKMNEEFGTLKDMIPACNGHDMHKLSILQASIDYVNYLEQCVKDLKTAGTRAASASASAAAAASLPFPSAPPSPTSPEFFAASVDNLHWSSVSPEILPGNGTKRGKNDDITSPSFSPHSRVSSTSYAPTEVAPTVLPSPALVPIHHPTDLSSPPLPPQQQQQQQHFWAASSPNLQAQQNHVSYDSAETNIDHEASAALLMLNRDRRGTIDSINECITDANTETSSGVHGGSDHIDVQESRKRTSMSVRDLLNS